MRWECKDMHDDVAAEMAYNGLCLAAENGLDVPWDVDGVCGPQTNVYDQVEVRVSTRDGETIVLTVTVLP